MARTQSRRSCWGDAALAAKVAEAMLAKGVYVIGFSYPVVAARPGAHPHTDFGRRIRTRIWISRLMLLRK